MRLDDFTTFRIALRHAPVALLLCMMTGCSPDDGTTPAPGGGGGAGGGMGAGGRGAAGAGSPDAATTDGTCAKPIDPSASALCLTFAPEILSLGTTPDLDGQGVLALQLVERETATVLEDVLLPPQPDPATPVETSIYDLDPLRFDGLPTAVDVIAVFIDNPIALTTPEPVWGTWLAGSLRDPMATDGLRLTLEPGEARELTVPLTALRLLRLQVSLAAGVTPLDDGQGPVLAALYDGPDIGTARLAGQGGLGCADLSESQTVELAVTALGAGPHYVGVALNDFNVAEEPFSGSIWNPSTLGTNVLLEETVTFDEEQYARDFATELVRISPVDASSPPPGFACPP